MLESIQTSPRTEVFYEAPHRIKESIEDVVAVLGPERHIVVARELTKMHEEFLRGTARQVVADLKERGDVKGEITLLIGKFEVSAQPPAAASVGQRVTLAMQADGVDEKTALKKVAKEMGIGKSEAYRELQRTRNTGVEK
jgi:16S rRNA (cytidine1402-2'-O)-methyltransferase